MDSFDTPWAAGLEQGPVWLRKYCARELGKSDDARAAAHLCAALNDHAVAESVIAALVQLGELAVGPLCEALRHQDGRVRGHAADALGRLPDPRAVGPLCETLKDEQRSVRAQAIQALGKIGDPQAAPSLIELLKHPDWDARRQAAGALGEIGTPAAPSLCVALRDEDSHVRGQAALLLGKVGDRHAVPPLCDALAAGQVEAASALGEIAGRDPVVELAAAVPLLYERLELMYRFDSSDTQRALGLALQQIETALAATIHLPIPASTPEPSTESLPLPAVPPALDTLPVPPAADGGEAAVPEQPGLSFGV